MLALTPPPQRHLCAACELLTERHVALLAFAARLPATPETEKRRVEPGALRTAALAALKSFPGSAALLVMLTAAEARCSAWTRLRRALDLTLVDAPAPQRLAVWLQALRVWRLLSILPPIAEQVQLTEHKSSTSQRAALTRFTHTRR